MGIIKSKNFFIKHLKAKSFKLKAKNGFTLVELILYIALAAVILLATTELLGLVLTSRIKNQTIAEIEQEGSRVLNIISFEIRNSDAVTGPPPAGSNSTLTLIKQNNPTPVIFSLSGNTLEMEETPGVTVPLTSKNVEVESVVFRNLSSPNTKGTIRIELRLKHKNSSGRNEYDFKQEFYGSASLR
jgi:Tfp pilus assembly protein PilW